MISLFDWHRRMGHCSMKSIVDMSNGAVTGTRPKDIPDDIPKLGTCHFCALTKSQRLPFNSGRTRPTEPLELIHGDLVGSMPVESVSRCKYGFVLMDDYSRASWVLLLRAKSDVHETRCQPHPRLLMRHESRPTKQLLGNLDDRGVMGYLLGYKYDGGGTSLIVRGSGVDGVELNED